MGFRSDLNFAKQRIDSALQKIENENPGLADIVDLLEAIAPVDSFYEEGFCAEIDEYYSMPKGTTYRDGVSLEFYIEADDWHRISVAFRKLKQMSLGA